MPNPSAVKASDVNIEIGVGSTTTLKWGNNWVRNVATQYTGTDSDVNASKMRWGINFPGGSLSESYLNDGAYAKTYQYSANLDIGATDLGLGSAIAYSNLIVHSNGTLELLAVAGVYSQQQSITWLTSGSNSDYTAQLIKYDAAATPGPSATNTDLDLATTRQWGILSASGGGTASNYANTRLVIKSAGTTLLNRAVNFSAYAEAY